jgi:thioredoxin reductase
LVKPFVQSFRNLQRKDFFMQNAFDVVIVGGSYAGLSAALALGRALRKVLVIDSGTPCNGSTPHSHNFLTRDGETPAAITKQARKELETYSTVTLLSGKVKYVIRRDWLFQICTEEEAFFHSKKILLATGLKDEMPAIEGFADCWGITILHCPYCHGYEVKKEPTGIIANGDFGFDFIKVVSNWTDQLTVFTNGPSQFSGEQRSRIVSNGVPIVESEIISVRHRAGFIKNIICKNGSSYEMKALYAKPAFRQQTDLASKLGCELTEQGLIRTDQFQKTSVPGVFAAGDNCNWGRAVSFSVASGSVAGMMINRELRDEEF